MSSSIVRDAFVRSVACDAAAGQLPDEPRVDGAERELRSRGASACASSHSSFVAEKYGSGTSPVRAPQQLGRQLRGSARRCAGPATRSRARPRRPVARSQRTVVSRWFAIPIAASSDGADRRPTGPQPRRHRARTPRSPPGRARPSRAADSAAEARGSRGRARESSSSTTRHVVPVVPWSIARITTRAARRPAPVPRPSPAR